MKLIYLACPYTAPTLELMKGRTVLATKQAAKLMMEGHNVFSPLTHSDPIADYLTEEIRIDHQFWMDRDLQIIEKCDEVHVMRLDGWDKSKGIAAELKFAMEIGKPIHFIDGLVEF